MTDPLKDLEQELRAMKPVDVPERVKGNIARALTEEEARPSVVEYVRARWIGFVALGAAAMLVVSMAYRIEDNKSGISDSAGTVEIAKADRPRPVNVSAAQPVMYGKTYSGDYDVSPVIVTDGVPVRFVRYGTVEHVLWSNSADGVQYKISVPKEEMIPVSVQTY